MVYVVNIFGTLLCVVAGYVACMDTNPLVLPPFFIGMIGGALALVRIPS
jgi:hypothetical protein